MKKIWGAHKLAIIIISFLALLFLVMFFLARPLVNDIKNKADDIQKKIIDNDISRKRVGKIPEMEKADKLFRSKESELNVILDPNNEFEFIKKLEAMADETGNEMTLKVNDPNDAKNVKTNKKDEKKGIKESLAYTSYISVEINLVGDYLELINFVHKLENFSYYANIISIDSKKIAEVSENKVDSAKTESTNPFAAPSLPGPQERIEKKEKDVIKSILNVVIYTKK